MLSIFFLTISLVSAKTCCAPGEPCWPSTSDLQSLKEKLDPTTSRTLIYAGKGHPRVCAVPVHSPNEQPLYGEGLASLQPLYMNDHPSCLTKPDSTPFCRVGVRNMPKKDTEPLIVAFPKTAQHVQTLIQFANTHQLCVSVAGTGHDFLNRHSRKNSLLIRTTLMKDIQQDENTITVGPGLVFDEIQYELGKVGKFVASGWATSVGIIGWSIGGGHGPFSPSKGLGVDNIVSAQVVLANGDLVTASATSNSDLYKALRGGGGSNWGIITSLQVKTHKVPSGGITRMVLYWEGPFYDDHSVLENAIDEYMALTLTLNQQWGQLAFVSVAPAENECKLKWTIMMVLVFQGSKTDAAWIKVTSKLKESGTQIDPEETFANWFDQLLKQPLEPIVGSEVSYSFPPSAIIKRETVPQLASHMKKVLGTNGCDDNGENCKMFQIYQALTGNIDSPQDPMSSIPSGMRTGIFHVLEINNQDDPQSNGLYTLGEHSYFSESAPDIKDWKKRYWGDKYEALLATKHKYDPNYFFTCHHCVGSDELALSSSPYKIKPSNSSLSF